MSAIYEAEIEALEPPARRPGTAVRFLLFLAAALGTAVVLAVGFPPGAPDRLPVLLVALALAVDAVLKPSRAIRDFCLGFPLAGLAAAICGSTDPVAWPIVLFGGLAAGATFRFLYDFDSVPDPSRLDLPIRGVIALWSLAALLAIARARTLWAALRGLDGRAVNAEGLLETAAIRESVLALAALAAGAGLFFLLRRAGAETRAMAAGAALTGVTLSAGAAVLQAVGIFPAETRAFWRLTGRLSGGATDPNALGLLCGLGIPLLVAFVARPPRPRWAVGALVALPLGLVLSGSRSGFVVAVLGSAAALLFAREGRRLRSAALLAAAAVAAILLGAVLVRGSPGDVAERLAHLFRSSLSLEDRASSRPILWRAALRQFAGAPVEGGGLGSFAWTLPDLAGAERARVPMRDNPGNAYLQALSETGILGLAALLLLVGAIARDAVARLRQGTGAATGGAAAVLAFLVALIVGSHWLAPDVALLFFLLAAIVAVPAPEATGRASRAGVPLAAILVLYAAFGARAALATLAPEETFRSSRLIGFHDPEAGAAGTFRWTRRRFAIWSPPEEAARLALANYTPLGRPVDVSVAAEGKALYRRTIAPGETVHLSLRSPGRRRAFEFALSRSFVPKRLVVSDDRRELGLIAVMD